MTRTKKSTAMSPQPDVSYLLFPTLLDSFTSYKRAGEIYEEYYGWSESPSCTLEEFERKSFQSLIDSINRVPFDNEAVAKGTAFNEVVDCIVENRKSDKIEVARVYEQTGYDGEPLNGHLAALDAKIGERTFSFPIGIVMEFADYFKGASTQVYVEGVLPTCFGNVKLYGYVDELLPLSVHDIKTTGRYSVGKYKRNWQHIVYPYCLGCMGNSVSVFEYNITDFKETYTETYVFDKERDTKRLREEAEELIVFLRDNKDLITNEKIFNYRHEQVSK